MNQTELTPQCKADGLQFVRSQSAAGRIRALVLDLVNQALRVQEARLSNAEKDALAHEILEAILLDMLGEYQGTVSPN